MCPNVFNHILNCIGLSLQLTELEERAEELDKKRTSSIATVALINDRNRKANVSKAEVQVFNDFLIIYASISFKLKIAGSHPARDHSQKDGGRRVEPLRPAQVQPQNGDQALHPVV